MRMDRVEAPAMALTGRLSRRTALRGLTGGAAIVLAARTAGMRATAQDVATPGASPTAGGQVTLEWLGWSHFRLTSPAAR